jgi:hypothetical protein
MLLIIVIVMLFQMLCHLRDSKARYAKAPELSPIEELK